MADKLTEKKYWEAYWKDIDLPLEVTQKSSSPNILAELDIFERYLPQKKLSILEIGGAPGQYLAWFHKTFGYEISCLDYTLTGCDKTRENFKLLNISGRVYHGDLFSDELDLPKFDVVCSFGFVEHFSDLNQVIEKHLEFLKPGGILILGVPNFLGINHLFLKQLAPELLLGHNLKSMDKKTWQSFEEVFQLKEIFKDYVGGFEPAVFLRREHKSFFTNFLYFKARILNKIFHSNMKFLRKYNSKYFSGYLMGIYQKPFN